VGSAENQSDHRRENNLRSPDPTQGQTEDVANTPREQALWSYAGYSEHGRDLTFTGHVTYLGGAAGERLRGELSVVIRDLLIWAAATRNAAKEPSVQQGDTPA
jgi:hypothetical protein